MENKEDKKVDLNEELFQEKETLKRLIDLEEQDDFGGMDFLTPKFKEADKKVESGEIKCNLDNPEDCEACGS